MEKIQQEWDYRENKHVEVFESICTRHKRDHRRNRKLLRITPVPFSLEASRLLSNIIKVEIKDIQNGQFAEKILVCESRSRNKNWYMNKEMFENKVLKIHEPKSDDMT